MNLQVLFRALAQRTWTEGSVRWGSGFLRPTYRLHCSAFFGLTNFIGRIL